MSSGYTISLDSKFADRFVPLVDQYSDEGDFQGPDISDEEAQDFFACGNFSDLEPLLARIPSREADLLDLYYGKGKKQLDIAKIFGVTQAAISYRLVRAVERLKFILTLPKITEEGMRAALATVFSHLSQCPKCRAKDPECTVCQGIGQIQVDTEIMVGIWHITCQSDVAKQLNLSQGKVRFRFFKAVKKLKEATTKQPDNVDLAAISQIFSSISDKNFNILKSVKLPQWSDRGNDEV